MIRIWGTKAVEQSGPGALLPANAKPHSVKDAKLVLTSPAFGTFISWTLADNEDFYLQTLTGQGPGAATYVVKIDGIEVAWGRSSTAKPTIDLDFGSGYIKVSAGETLTVEVQHWLDNTRDFFVVIGGGLVTGN